MSSVASSISCALEDPTRYNYFTDLIEASSRAQTDPELSKYIPTLELFTFGNISHYFQHQDRVMELSGKHIEKLVKLTIHDVVSANDGGEFPLSQVYHPDSTKALEAIGKDNFTVEVLLLEIGSEAADIRIDDVNGTVKVLEVTKYRDVYDPQLYKTVMIDATPLEAYKQELVRWQKQITVVRGEESAETQVEGDDNVKKRKMDMGCE